LVSTLHFILDDDEAHRVVRRLVDALAPGSYLAASVATDDFAAEPLDRVREIYEAYGEQLRFRTKAQAERFFAGLEPVAPGLVQIHQWRPEPGAAPLTDADVAMYGAVARKP
jgi:hypothetical protein